MNDINNERIAISNTEFEVLEALWLDFPASANEIIEQLNRRVSTVKTNLEKVNVEKIWHEKTVKTLLNRLVRKNAISFEKQQRYYLYTPLLERERYTIKESKNFIEKFFSGRLSPLVAGFAKQSDLQKEDIDELKRVIAQWEQENSKIEKSE